MTLGGERGYGLPDGIRENVEIVESAKLLREDCVGILSEYGTPVTKKGLSKVRRIGIDFLNLQSGAWTKDERLNRYVYTTSVDVGKGNPFGVTITSLGKTSPKDARHIVIYIPELMTDETCLAIDGDNNPRELRVQPKKDPNENIYYEYVFLQLPKIRMDQMISFSQAINLVKKNPRPIHDLSKLEF